MKDKFGQLLIEFIGLTQKNGYGFVISIIQEYCNRHKLSGPDGLAGLLDYIRVNYERKDVNSRDDSVIRSFGETAYLLWALEKVGRKDLADAVAKQMQSGWDFGETRGYKNEEANYFRSFEIELNVGLRLLEYNLNIEAGGEGEPDYIIDSPQLVLEVKAPGSEKGLYQCIIKAVKQIEKYGKKGVIVIVLDNMVKRGMINNPADGLDKYLIDIICSALPTFEKYSTIGIIVEWVNWDNSKDCSSIVQAFMLTSKKDGDNEKLITLVLRAVASENEDESKIIFCESQNPFPYDDYRLEDIDPSSDGEQFYEKYFSSKKM
ncbi:MAG: hypothetical protein Q8936_20535 [Bacillota bacterium]|nr:hypothetical protein [Bacillota bacterium]